MLKAGNDPITPTARWPSCGKPGTALPLPVIPTAPPAPSPRALLAGSTAALLTGAAAVTVARAAPLAASAAAAGEDAELLRLCTEFHRIRASALDVPIDDILDSVRCFGSSAASPTSSWLCRTAPTLGARRKPVWRSRC